ncbi:WRKY transcription factor [Actinidia chinensis var. chinensis]|uniref:WRKY transcription factor n=1 Tax=Actinidia chinensis var. chinensis TaxID=1590841 RepID=A0A2R6PWR2_ACTCC|nr:WRKY transcription factor [Actinidia chinensis var. chinensis]
MEVNKAERIVIVKPVPSRPTCSSFRSVSELLAGAINSSPSNACFATAVSAIRPKTVRVKPMANRSPVGMLSSQTEVSSAVSYSSDKVLNSDSKANVLYRPLAKVVSKTTLSLSENLGNSNICHQQALAQVEASAQPPSQFKYHFRSDLSPNDLHQNFSPLSEREKKNEPSKMASENMEDDQKCLPFNHNGDRYSYDRYNWRKYGKKQVKGSDYVRSYYKCTHPNCPVKKKVERSLDGQIAEIVYKGEHNHSKPQPVRRNTSGGQGNIFISDGTGQDTNNPSLSNQLNERIDGSEGRTENQIAVGLSGKGLLSYDPVAARVSKFNVGIPENSCGLSGDYEEGSKKGLEEADEPRSKRRKNENELGISGGEVQAQGALVQSNIDSEIIGDGCHWKKYGQKIVKGNPYPRCSNLNCNVRKHVERASDDPKAFITTYEGKHNHDMPIRNTVGSEPDSQAATSKDKP